MANAKSKPTTKLDYALNTQVFFKKKDTKLRNPYTKSQISTNANQSAIRSSVDINHFNIPSRRTYFNATGDSTRESNIK